MENKSPVHKTTTAGNSKGRDSSTSIEIYPNNVSINQIRIIFTCHVLWNTRMHLGNSLMYFGDGVIISAELRQDVLDGLHLEHQGVTLIIL